MRRLDLTFEDVHDLLQGNTINAMIEDGEEVLTSADLAEFGEVLYEKCLVCHLFVEENYQGVVEAINLDIARYVHLARGDDEDDALDASHEPHPSGVKMPLAVWKMFGPAPMLARFTPREAS